MKFVKAVRAIPGPPHRCHDSCPGCPGLSRIDTLVVQKCTSISPQTCEMVKGTSGVPNLIEVHAAKLDRELRSAKV